MYRWMRSVHKIAGLVGSLFLILIAVTGFLLALKGVIGGIRPPTEKGIKIDSLAAAVHPNVAVQSAFSKGLPGLTKLDHVDRFEFHADKGVYKILSKEGYHEVQVDAGTGDVLAVGRRNDQMFEDIHDLSFLHPALRETVLPVVAALLFSLGCTGLVMYFVPVFRRAKHRKTKAA